MADIIFWKPNDFRGTLITNLTPDFHFSKWRIQYGGYEILETL